MALACGVSDQANVQLPGRSPSRLIYQVAALAACFVLVFFSSPLKAQPRATPRQVGVLLGSFTAERKEVQEFRLALQDAGYSEGREVVIEWRHANGDYAQLPQLAEDLVQRKVDVIVVESTLAAQAAKRATATIPIVMAVVADPLGSGLVTNLAHPGENVTGLSLMMADLTTKRLQLLKEAIPRLSRLAVLWNPDTPYHPKVIQDIKVTAPSLGIGLTFVAAKAPQQFASALSAAHRAHAQALYVIEDPLFFNRRTTLIGLATKARLPIIYWVQEFAEAGGLMSYGANYSDLMHQSVWYVDKIFKGAKPADLPIQQPTKINLVVNLKAADALGLRIPQSIVLRADHVIQ